MKQGILIVNLGTPDSTSEGDVRKYLKEFLSDPYVIDIPALFRWALLKFFILPKRPAESAEAYKKIWTKRGSPLMFHTVDYCKALQKELKIPVACSMRYQSPSIEEGVKELVQAGVDHIVAWPVFPQYSLAAYETAAVKVRKVVSKLGFSGKLDLVPAVFDDPLFAKAFSTVAHEATEKKGFKPDHYLMSFHGVPERHCRKTVDKGYPCTKNKDCCDTLRSENINCYRAQCVVSAKVIAKEMGLGDDQWTIGFQSRLGRTPWIQPYTDELLPKFAGQGVKNLAVLCPSFVSDCLETLEEIQMRAKEDFVKAGGEDLFLIPSLNASDVWVKNSAEILRVNYL